MAADSVTTNEPTDKSWRKNFRRLHGELTAAEQRAGEFFESHPEAAYRSISEVVALSEIGYGTIIRFCQKLGCKGFQEFKLMLATDGVVNGHSEGGANDRPGSEAARRLRTDLSETLRLLEEGDLQHAAQQLLGCRVVLIVGVASSAPLVTSLAWKLSRIGIDARPSTEGYVMAVNATLLTQDDVLFAISSSGATKDILHAAKVATAHGASLIALTNFSSSPLSQLAEISLFTTSNRDPVKAEVPSIIAGEAVLEMLLEKLLIMEPQRREHLLQSSRAVSDRKL
ncbi:MurR/RpiR family transcriptional regulator [Bremerella alba]|uniref:HTH-type transcriptional regulator MurR n=1 Tax=Bremerella alba TaxID=980252 RepID=A0A7V8V5R7_9BACT|nr:MurR/RpiR family transcriptional regulator [Bremerella alba]MBA2115423.1 HTH-type transcriptional regulator MurR [Bremerella alba]